MKSNFEAMNVLNKEEQCQIKGGGGTWSWSSDRLAFPTDSLLAHILTDGLLGNH